MSRTKITGWLLLVVAVLKTVADLVDGSGFSVSAHLGDAQVALGGLGLVFLRDAVGKVKKAIGK